MTTNLIKRYEELTMEQRVNATREAEAAGMREAAADAGAAGGAEIREADAHLYYMLLIDQADTDETSATEEDLDGDPRVAAFARGWRVEQAERVGREI